MLCPDRACRYPMGIEFCLKRGVESRVVRPCMAIRVQVIGIYTYRFVPQIDHRETLACTKSLRRDTGRGREIGRSNTVLGSRIEGYTSIYGNNGVESCGKEEQRDIQSCIHAFMHHSLRFKGETQRTRQVSILGTMSIYGNNHLDRKGGTQV